MTHRVGVDVEFGARVTKPDLARYTRPGRYCPADRGPGLDLARHGDDRAREPGLTGGRSRPWCGPGR
ncbi:hypothetical protein [Amycolatopsis sp. NPDC051903]|uniref:hypothetical protein n=1 Tax=Amycolatopsis sp. NPDC051903 TaxID=3363936 RepID=UPI0037A74148